MTADRRRPDHLPVARFAGWCHVDQCELRQYKNVSARDPGSFRHRDVWAITIAQEVRVVELGSTGGQDADALAVQIAQRFRSFDQGHANVLESTEQRFLADANSRGRFVGHDVVKEVANGSGVEVGAEVRDERHMQGPGAEAEALPNGQWCKREYRDEPEHALDVTADRRASVERMGASDYVLRLRDSVGHDLLSLPGVSAVILDDRNRVLLGLHLPSRRWGLIGGSVEPEEDPADAVLREIREELGAEAEVIALLGAYGGAEHTARYPNGDVVSYVLVSYLVELRSSIGRLEADELEDARWFERSEIDALERHSWIDQIIDSALEITAR